MLRRKFELEMERALKLKRMSKRDPQTRPGGAAQKPENPEPQRLESRIPEPQRPEPRIPESRTPESQRPAVAAGPRIFLPAIASGLLLWASFAPLGYSWLAWLAPIGWLGVIEQQPVPGKRGYWILWLSGSLFWLLILQGVRLAFWPLIFGWLAISFYLGVYVPLFVGIARIMRFQWHWPLCFAAPVAWVGLEVARSHFLTGFGTNLLGHTQAHVPWMIQIADQVGGYGVSFVLMAMAVGLRQLWLSASTRSFSRLYLPVGFAGTLVAITLGYGWWRLRQSDVLASAKPLLRVLLIQENTPSIFEVNPERTRRAWLRYVDATRDAARRYGVADLVVWPESTFAAGVPWMRVDLTNDQLPEKLIRQEATLESVTYYNEKYGSEFAYKVNVVLAAARDQNLLSPPANRDEARPYLLLGSDAVLVRSQGVDQFNSALLVGPDAAYIDRYDKIHRVMFGEYIPLGPLLSFLADAFGAGSIQPGTEVKSFDIAGAQVAPSICFESMLPEFVSWQVRQLRRANTPPDILVNMTNDSWFWGSSILDHHLACSIFCAVENRRPLLIAANTGLSGHVDGAGRVLQVSPRLEKALLLVEPRADARIGLVQLVGYPAAWFCCATALLALLTAWFRRRRQAI